METPDHLTPDSPPPITHVEFKAVMLLGVIAAARHHRRRSGRLPVEPDTAGLGRRAVQ